MAWRFLPREGNFFDLFDKHAELCVLGATELLAMVSNEGSSPAKAKRIKEIEHEADVITHTCVEQLHRTFVTPLDREDIHRVISRMDDVIDFIEAAAERIAIYELTEMTPEVRELAALRVRASGRSTSRG
jgi:hypothetical protein